MECGLYLVVGVYDKLFHDTNASINELEGFIKNQVMKEAIITDESIFNQVFSDFNYKDYIKYNYIMVDLDNKEKFNEVKNRSYKLCFGSYWNFCDFLCCF